MSNEAIRRPVRHTLLGPNGVRIPITLQEIAYRLSTLRAQVSFPQQMLKKLRLEYASVRGTPQEAQCLARIKEIMIEHNRRKEMIASFAVCTSETVFIVFIHFIS
jgi:hypothetical protein